MNERLAAPVQYLKGVGPSRARALAGAGVRSVEDLFLYAPRRYVDRRLCLPIRDLEEGEQASVLAEVAAAGVARGRRPRFVAKFTDGTGLLEGVWFRGVGYVKDALKAGDLVALSGKVGSYRGALQMAHPEFEVLGSSADADEPADLLDEAVHTGGLIPIYPLTAGLRAVGLASRGLRRIIRGALDAFREEAGPLPDDLPEAIRERRGLLDRDSALEQIHFPSDPESAEAARRRLAYEEFFLMELLLAERSRSVQRRPGRSFETRGPLVGAYLQGLGFRPTGAQQRALTEVFEDMARPHPMNRLLQGDVGSGKTMVAACVLLTAVENDTQAALMAPTEILAEQHASRLKTEFGRLDTEVVFLTSRLGARERREAVARLDSGSPVVAVGTHALIQEDVDFSNLGAVVVDEQHRFGVLQRGALQAKGTDPDVLVMTATPIPRTLAMTLYGDLETTIIDEMPPGREPVKTVRIPLSRRDKVVERVREVLEEGRQAYWVFPLVEESEKSDLRAAAESFEQLASGPLEGRRLGLLHGRMPPEEKDRVMDGFRSGEIELLVSTTVIEVGVDVPNASLILIEHAERFGLSQLHQLRGRVGRGGGEAACVLLAPEELTEEGERRLQAMEETTDGFKIAEADLQIRGPGEFFGTRQSGLPDLRIASLVGDQALLAQARSDAFAALGVGEGREPAVGGETLARWKEALDRRMGTRMALGDIA
ncbi:MAG: ATP-dependent DNA helicase RecG [bacterium]